VMFYIVVPIYAKPRIFYGMSRKFLYEMAWHRQLNGIGEPSIEELWLCMRYQA